MLTRRIIPCLDVRDGRVVKGIRFASIRDAGDPVRQAALYQQQGADELVILDISATPDARSTAIDTVAAVRRELAIPLTVGGGVRTLADAERLLEAGADKVAVNTAAVDRPEILAELSGRTGAQCVVLAIDAARTPGPTDTAPAWEVVTRSGTNRTAADAVGWAARAESFGIGEILLTSFDRDGTGEGYDLDLLRAMSARVRVPIIASGGASGPAHMLEAFEAGADAVLAASIFHDAVMTVADVKHILSQARVAVRL